MQTHSWSSLQAISTSTLNQVSCKMEPLSKQPRTKSLVRQPPPRQHIENEEEYCMQHVESKMQARMKEKLQEIYRKMQKNSSTRQAGLLEGNTRTRYGPALNSSNSKFVMNYTQVIRQELTKLGYQAKGRPRDDQPLGLSISISMQDRAMDLPSIKILSHTKYSPRLKSNKVTSLSNNISDYLSVEKVNIKDLEPQRVEHDQVNKQGKSNKLRSYLSYNSSNGFQKQLLPLLSKISTDNTPRKMNSHRLVLNTLRAQPPYETYYYRDLVWRVAFSNQVLLQFPPDYSSKVKVYVGRGNNSGLIRDTFGRRPWYQVTEKVEEASIVWTQLKLNSLVKALPKWQKLVKGNMKGKKSNIFIRNSLWTEGQEHIFVHYKAVYQSAESKMSESMQTRNKLIAKIISKNPQLLPNNRNVDIAYAELDDKSGPRAAKAKIHNHFHSSSIIGDKKALLHTMSSYYSKCGRNVFDHLPVTFHISDGLQDPQFTRFLAHYQVTAKDMHLNPENYNNGNVWIVKPGQNTNRGHGINVCLTLDEVLEIIKKFQKHSKGATKTCIIQKYIEKPMLYKRRKFDIRHYFMVNCCRGMVKGYWFREGYVRTASSEYTLKQAGGGVHLTNDAVQKDLPDYGKYEKGNKISYAELDEYLLKNGRPSFWGQCYPQMRKIGIDVMRASAGRLDPQRRTGFQIFGMDFMLDEELHVWLIEVNTNPCLELSCPLLTRLIPKMIEQTFQICIDPLYPAPVSFQPRSAAFTKNSVEEMEYELVYDERYELNEGSQTLKNEEQCDPLNDESHQQDK